MIKNKSKMIGARVTDEEYKLIERESRRRNQRKSEFIRDILLQCAYAYKLSQSEK